MSDDFADNSATDDITFSRQAGWGVICLSRPKALNSLTFEMCAALEATLAAWAQDDAVHAVMIEGAGDRAFCAGGNIRWLSQTAKADPAAAADFFRVEYKLNARIAAFPKPYVALLDGVTMGGGVGVSMNASHRIVTDRTLWAMPECAIGLVPDIGASYTLSQLPGGLGQYLGLTGARLDGADCMVATLGTHYMPAAELPTVRAALLAAPVQAGATPAINEILAPFRSTRPGGLIEKLKFIGRFFDRIDDIQGLLDQLHRMAGQDRYAKDAYYMMNTASPTSLALTHALFSDVPATFNAAITREFCVMARLMEGPDFLEGVRAQIIDKDRMPKWAPGRITDLSADMIGAYFAAPPGGPLDLSAIS